MFRAIIFFFIISHESIADSNWYACGKNSDCIIVQGVCDKTSINKNYTKEAVKHFSRLAQVASCPKPADKSYIGNCIENKCQKKEVSPTKVKLNP